MNTQQQTHPTATGTCTGKHCADHVPVPTTAKHRKIGPGQ